MDTHPSLGEVFDEHVEDRVVDELIVRFTHDREIDVLLPGIQPTGRRVELPHVVVMGFEGGKVAYEHIYWDQGSPFAQVGLIDADALPVTGADQDHGLVDRSVPLNALLGR